MLAGAVGVETRHKLSCCCVENSFKQNCANGHDEQQGEDRRVPADEIAEVVHGSMSSVRETLRGEQMLGRERVMRRFFRVQVRQNKAVQERTKTDVDCATAIDAGFMHRLKTRQWSVS